MSHYSIYHCGDQAITIQTGQSISPEINDRSVALQQQILAANITGIKEAVAAYHTVTVVYDAFHIHRHIHTTSPGQWITEQIQQIIRTSITPAAVHRRNISVPACFHPDVSPDLAYLAATKQLSVDELIQVFTSQTYRVYMLGFLPGFPYMGTVPDAIASPRKEKPHLNILPGSIGIAGIQTGIYPLQSPGGWNIIGRTPLLIFDPHKASPCFFQQGDAVQFEAISLDTFHQLNQHS